MTSETFTRAVTLAEVPAQHLDRAFIATTQYCPWPKAYGGDLVAPALAAAMRTVDDGKSVHSSHSYFLRPADIGAEVRYEVELLRDGRGYSTRLVRAYGADKLVYICMVGFAAGEPGPALSSPMPDGIPLPQNLPSSEQYLAEREGGRLTPESLQYWATQRSFDMRHVPGPIYVVVEGSSVPWQAIWLRPFDALRPVPGLDEAQRDAVALAYVCDYTILEPILRGLCLAWADEGLVTASLDHSMWFHRPPSMDGWVLYAQEAFSAADGRGLAVGRFFGEDGTHFATVAQEGLIRTGVHA